MAFPLPRTVALDKQVERYLKTGVPLSEMLHYSIERETYGLTILHLKVRVDNARFDSVKDEPVEQTIEERVQRAADAIIKAWLRDRKCCHCAD
jgi:hypothetical protein